jgi:hypothetical protein
MFEANFRFFEINAECKCRYSQQGICSQHFSSLANSDEYLKLFQAVFSKISKLKPNLERFQHPDRHLKP